MVRGIVIGFIVLILVAAAGVGGYMYGNQVGFANANNVRSTFLQNRGLAGQGAGGAAGGAGAGFTGGNGANGANGGLNAANFANGTVQSVSGDTVQITTARDPQPVTVKITSSTAISKTVAGTTADLTQGQRIVVVGPRGTDGTITAESIQIGAGFGIPGGAAGGFGGRRGTPEPGQQATPAP